MKILILLEISFLVSPFVVNENNDQKLVLDSSTNLQITTTSRNLDLVFDDSNLFEDTNFIIEFSRNIPSSVALYKNNNLVQIKHTYGGNLSIEFTCLEKDNLKLSSFTDNGSSTANVGFAAKNPVHFNSISNGGLDTKNDIDSLKVLFNNNGYYLYNHYNGSESNLNTIGQNGRTHVNNDFYMISSHGWADGSTIINGINTMSKNSYPNMGNVKIALWKVCHGGEINSIAKYAYANLGVDYSIGFEGSIYQDTSNYWCNRFWTAYFLNNNVLTSFNVAKNDTNAMYWLLLNVRNDGTKNPKIFPGSLSNFTCYDNVLKNEYIIDNSFFNGGNYEIMSINNRNIFTKKYNNVYFMDYGYQNNGNFYRIKNYISDSEKEIYLLSNKGINKLSFVVKENGIIDEVIYNDESKELIKDGVVYSSDKLMEYFIL